VGWPCPDRTLSRAGLAWLPGKRLLFWFLVQPGRQTPGSAFAEMNLRLLVLTGGRERTIDALLRPRRRRLPAKLAFS
jgi:hypothetical protein